jgi:hypothetical protein
MAQFSPGTRVKVVRNLVPCSRDMTGREGVVVRPPERYPHPVVVFIPGEYGTYRPPGQHSLFSFLEGELEPILNDPVIEEEAAYAA